MFTDAFVFNENCFHTLCLLRINCIEFETNFGTSIYHKSNDVHINMFSYFISFFFCVNFNFSCRKYFFISYFLGFYIVFVILSIYLFFFAKAITITYISPLIHTMLSAYSTINHWTNIYTYICTLISLWPTDEK